MLAYRALEFTDREAAASLDSYAFGTSPEPARFDPTIIGEMRGLWQADTLVAQLRLLDLQMQNGLTSLRTAGIASVASAPETRRQGHVALLLRHAAAELVEAGVALALLYPFKRTFYGRYGWANHVERRVYSGTPAQLAAFRHQTGSFALVGAEATDELDTIYRAALRGRFGPLVRDAQWWQQRILRDYYAQQQPHIYTAIWRDEQGRGRAYLVYEILQRADGRHVRCREIVAMDPTARAHLFAYLAGHADQIRQIEFPAPADAPVNFVLPDPLDCQVAPYLMLRMLDVTAALTQYTFPPDLSGHITFTIHDDWLAQNNAAFDLTVSDGVAHVQRLPIGSVTGLSLDVRALTQIYSRAVRPRSAAAFGLIEVRDRAQLNALDRLFAGLPPYSSDFF